MRPMRRRLDAHPERGSDLVGDRGARRCGIELNGAADQVRRVQITKHEVWRQ